MDEFLASKGMARIIDLKVGDKFYSMDWHDDKVYELVHLSRVLGEEDTFEYSVRLLGSKIIIRHTITRTNVVNRMVVLRFKGRDRGSFVAGFKAAMRNYQKHMQIFDQENASLDNPVNCWQTMTNEYHKWMKNN